jgi:uncharacterized protein (DUF1330 family)
MVAYIILVPHERPANPEAMRPYREQVEAIMAPYGGRYRTLVRQRVEVLEGDWHPDLGVGILEFPSFEQAWAWYHSPEYAPLRALRMATIPQQDVILVDGMFEGETLEQVMARYA